MESRFKDLKDYKIAKIINSGQESNITEISRKLGLPISHVSVVLDWWMQSGIIEKEKKGQEVIVSFTDFGNNSFKKFEDFMKCCEKAGENRDIFIKDKGGVKNGS